MANSIHSSSYEDFIVEQTRSLTSGGEGITVTELPLPDEVVDLSEQVAQHFANQTPKVRHDDYRFYQFCTYFAVDDEARLLASARDVVNVHSHLVSAALGRRAFLSVLAHNNQDPGAVGVLHIDKGTAVSLTFNEGQTRVSFAQTDTDYNDPAICSETKLLESGIGVAMGTGFPRVLRKKVKPPLHRWEETSGVTSRRSLVLGFQLVPLLRFPKK